MYNTRHKAIAMRDMYPKGTKVQLISMEDLYPIPSGTKGVVSYVDDACHIHVDWENGRSLALVPDSSDVFRVIA